MIKSGGDIERLFNFFKRKETQVDILRSSRAPLKHLDSLSLFFILIMISMTI